MMRSNTSAAPRETLAAAAATDPGRQRAQNEDRYYIDPPAGIFLVVDGVGGEAAGEVAAQIAVQTIANRLARRDGPPEVRVREAITLANQDILRQAREAHGRAGMACVLTLAVLDERRLTIGHVGDSRLYKLTPRGIAKLTHDHSPVGEREDAREISETEAMQHARRNEVYRDVGSEPRQPDAPDFIEIAVTALEDDAAILICSDGLSDMLTSVEIDRIARAHAGDPRGVVEALIAAANDAGGRDNITVVFVEGPTFSRHAAKAAGPALPASPSAPQVSTTPLTELRDPAERSKPQPSSAAAVTGQPVAPGRLRRIVQSRVLALILGTLLGLATTLALLVYGPYPVREHTGSRRLIVGSSAAGAYPSIGEALAGARPGDIVQVEPGEYAETLFLPAAVDLVARVPGTAVLVAPSGATGWISVTAVPGRSTFRGFRIEGRPEAPIRTGIAVPGGDLEIDDVTFEGGIATGVEISGAGGAVVLRSSRFNVVGVPLRVLEAATPRVRQNVFVAGADRRAAAVDVAAAAAPRLEGNVFFHFSQVIAPAARRDALLEGNFVIPSGGRR